MYNLPHQTFEDWKETLNKIIGLNPEHISAYSLILEEGTQLYDMYMDKDFTLLYRTLLIYPDAPGPNPM